MIKEISKIDNLAVFNKFEWDKCVLDKNGHPISFGKINILYGRNYSGKTTLSKIFQSIENHSLPDKYDNPQFEVVNDDGTTITQDTISTVSTPIRVFNEDFIRTNLRFLLDPNGEIAPFAILGADNAKIEEEIRTLEAEIGSNEENQETGLYKSFKEKNTKSEQSQTNLKNVQTALDNKLSAKTTDRTIGIKYHADKYGDQNYNIAKMRQDIATVTNTSYVGISAEEAKGLEQTLFEQIKPVTPELSVPKLQLASFCQVAEELLSRKIGVSNKIQELLRDAALNEWVERGSELLKGKKTCAFCGNTISDERWAIIHAHFDEESQELSNDIDALVNKISDEKESLKKPFTMKSENFYSKYVDIFVAFTETRAKEIEEYEKALELVSKQLLQRKANITIPITFNWPNYNPCTFSQLVSNFNQTIKANNEYSSHLNKEKVMAQKKLRLQAVADFCQTIDYTSQVKMISDLTTTARNAKNNADEVLKTLSAKIDELNGKRHQLNDEEKGAQHVNDYLNDYFGNHFVTLEAEKANDGDKTIRFQIMRNGKPAYNLSEGECSLIAFCYFMAKLDDTDTAGKKPIIWIDDPISSLDSNHVFFVYSLIVAKIAKTGNFEQLFISTHNLDFLKYLKRLKSYQPNTSGKLVSVPKQYFLIERVGTVSTLKKLPSYLQNNATEFNYLFSIIYRCSVCTTVTDENYDMLYSFGNNARKFLEMYLYFKYPDDTEELLPKLKRFFAPDDVPPILIDRMLNEDSHGPSLEQSQKVEIDPETIPVAKKIIDLLKTDSEQYKALLKSIDVTIA